MSYTPLVIFIAAVLIIGGTYLQYLIGKKVYNAVASNSLQPQTPNPTNQAGGGRGRGRGKHRGERD